MFDLSEEQKKDVRETWMDMWGLDADRDRIPPSLLSTETSSDPPSSSEHESEPLGTALARTHSNTLVLKPQREGGGNNIYRSSIPSFLSTLPPTDRSAWIAMQLIQPPTHISGYLVRSTPSGDNTDTQPVKARVVSELGVFGYALFRADSLGRGVDRENGREAKEAVKEDVVGWLVRTKADDVDEGGVAAGFSVLDSVLLVD